MDKMRMETRDGAARNIDALAKLFPACVTETADGKGGLKKAIDFARLKEILGENLTEEGHEAYEFTWVGKKAATLEANRPITKTLRPAKEESRDWDTTENLYIEGDNLDVLKLLQESYLGGVKCIYIDPPYNTGNDFIYRDDFKMGKDEYEEEQGLFDEEENRLVRNTDTNGRFHSDWCSMIYPRLVLARNLLAEDGVIFISIDYNENYNLRQIANEVFGTSNFVGEIYWESKTKSQNTKTSYNKLQPKLEMVLVYKKEQNKARFNLVVTGKKEYPLADEKGAYREYPVEVMNANGIRGRESMIYEISDGVSTVSPERGKQWQLGKSQVATYKEEGDLFIRDGKAIIKMRPEYEKGEITEPFWGFLSKEIGTAESAKKELSEYISGHGFESVKPVNLVKRLLFHATEKNDVILDFFSGSATTAHAVMQLNAEDGGHRKFILVQLPEPCDEKSEAYKAGFKNICEIGKERIRRAGDKIRAEHPDADIDTGFRVLKLDSSNMKDVYFAPEEYTQEKLLDTESNIKEDRTGLDLFFSCLLEWGLPLSHPITTEEVSGCTVYTYGGNGLTACFEKNIPESVIRAMAGKHPLRAVFRDAAFAGSPEKINVFEIFKLLSPDTTVKVI